MRYQYTSKGYLNSLKNNNAFSAVTQLIIMNVAIFILIYLSSSFSDWVGRHIILEFCFFKIGMIILRFFL